MTARWWTVLTVVLAGGYLYIGATSPLPAVRWPVLAGAVLVLIALRLAARHRGPATAVLVVGAVLPVVTAWWSVVVPVTGLLILLCGATAVRAGSRIGSQDASRVRRPGRTGVPAAHRSREG